MQSDAIAELYISRQQTKSCDTMANVTHIAKPEKLKIVFLRAFVPVMKCALGWSGIQRGSLIISSLGHSSLTGWSINWYGCVHCTVYSVHPLTYKLHDNQPSSKIVIYAPCAISYNAHRNQWQHCEHLFPLVGEQKEFENSPRNRNSMKINPFQLFLTPFPGW